MIRLFDPPQFVVLPRPSRLKRPPSVHIRKPGDTITVCGRRFERLAKQTEPGNLCRVCNVNVQVPPVGAPPVFPKMRGTGREG